MLNIKEKKSKDIRSKLQLAKQLDGVIFDETRREELSLVKLPHTLQPGSDQFESRNQSLYVNRDFKFSNICTKLYIIILEGKERP